MNRPPGIGDFIASFKGDSPGHPFRGNQYDGGSSSGLSDSDYPSKQEDYFDDNYSEGVTIPQAQAGDSRDKLRRIARDFASSARISSVGADAITATQEQADFVEGWAKRAFEGSPHTISQSKYGGSKWKVTIRRKRATYD